MQSSVNVVNAFSFLFLIKVFHLLLFLYNSYLCLWDRYTKPKPFYIYTKFKYRN